MDHWQLCVNTVILSVLAQDKTTRMRYSSLKNMYICLIREVLVTPITIDECLKEKG